MGWGKEGTSPSLLPARAAREVGERKKEVGWPTRHQTIEHRAIGRKREKSTSITWFVIPKAGRSVA